MASAATLEKTCSFYSTGTKDKKRSCKEDKCELVGFDSLPTFLKDNEFILNYYRSEWPWKQTILSIFSIHNETLNISTHLIGFIIFLTLTLCTMAYVPFPFLNQRSSDTVIALNTSEALSSSTTWYLTQVLATSMTGRTSLTNLNNYTNLMSSHVLRDDDVLESTTTTRWPFYAYLIGAMFCLFTSSVCHLLSCHSAHCAYTMLRLDYTGISMLIVTSFYPLVYYTFMCDPFVRNLYIGFITAFGVATILVSLVPVFQTPEFRSVRALLFFCMGVSGLVPIIHKLMVFGDQPVAVMTTVYELVMGGFYGLGVVVYAARVPERWMPGMFDLVGHSHQLFHVLVIAGAYTHYLASAMYLNWREMEGC